MFPGKTVSSFILLFICLGSAVAQNKKISGYVQNSITKECVPFATIYEVHNKKGITSDINGCFELNLRKHDSLLIEVSHVNYEKTAFNYLLEKDTVITLYVNEKQTTINEVVVSAKQKRQYEDYSSLSRITNSQLNYIPSLGGEKDIIKALQLTPGVQGGIEGTNEIIVRGGEPGQNLFLLDNMPIYSPSHLYGFFSTFNPDIVQSADIVRSGLTANYGGKMSSLVDVKTKPSSLNDANAIFSFGLIASKFYTQIPVIKNKSSLMLSFRRSYLDVLTKLKANYNLESERNEIGFYDAYLKYEHHISSKSFLSFNYLRSKDKYYYLIDDTEASGSSEDVTGPNWGNDAFFINFKQILKNNKSFSLFGSIYNYNYNYINESYFSGELDNSYEKSTAIKDYTIKAESRFNPDEKLRIIFGGSYVYHIITPTAITVNNEVLLNDKKYAEEAALFINAFYELDNKNKLSVGLRQNGYFAEEYLAYPLEPRLSLFTRVNEKWSLKSSLSRNVQFIHRIEDLSAGLPSEIWQISNKDLVFEDGCQVSTEVNYKLDNQNLSIGIAPYLRWMEGLATHSSYFSDLLLTTSLSRFSYEGSGNGKAYGIELYCNKSFGSLFLLSSYTFSYSYRRFENINDNNWYPSNYDRRHYFIFNAGYNLNERFTFSLNWNYSSGHPITLPSGRYSLYYSSEYDTPAYYTGYRNTYRLKDYHRLDVAFQNKKIKRNGYRIWELSIYNVYNRKNPFCIGVETSYSTVNGNAVSNGAVLKQYSLFSIVPSITYIRRFN